MKSSKHDNKSLGGKLVLRRYYLDKYHAGTTPLVFDACQGDAVIWTRLRHEYTVRYFGVDRKVKRGRISIDSVRLLENGPLPYDVIDVDTYGSPWRHWTTLLPHVRKPTTVFLTFGVINLSGADHHVLEELGLGRLVKRVPSTIAGRLLDLCVESLMAKCYDYNLTPHDPREIIGGSDYRARKRYGGAARYIGVRLVPLRKSKAEKPTASTNGAREDGEG